MCNRVACGRWARPWAISGCCRGCDCGVALRARLSIRRKLRRSGSAGAVVSSETRRPSARPRALCQSWASRRKHGSVVLPGSHRRGVRRGAPIRRAQEVHGIGAARDAASRRGHGPYAPPGAERGGRSVRGGRGPGSPRVWLRAWLLEPARRRAQSYSFARLASRTSRRGDDAAMPSGRGDDAAMGAWIAAVPSPGSRQNGPPRRRRDDAAMSRGRGGDDACAWIAAMRVVRGDVASTR